MSHFGFNKSPLFILKVLEAIGGSVRLAGVEAGGTVAAAALEARDFTSTSLAEAV